MNGILVINKEADYTSRDVVNVVSKKFGTKKVGHTGTLDPMATGVLVVCVGEATKLVEILMDHDKEYIAGVTLGIDTDTLDSTGTILKEEDVNVSKEQIIEVLNSFIGSYLQEVPKYSAVKINGKKLYEYARNNEDILLPKKEVTIDTLELIDEPLVHDGKVSFHIKTSVSKGTYIRSLIRDIASRLNTVGIMTSLVRTRVENYSLEEAKTLDELREEDLRPIVTALQSYKQIVVTDETILKKIKNGAPLENKDNRDVVVFLTSEMQVLAIYKKDEKNQKLLKSWKQFHI